MRLQRAPPLFLALLLIFAEKMFPRGERIAQGVGLVLILSGILVIVVPTTLL